MHSGTFDIFDKEIFITKKPFWFYLTLLLWGMLLVLFIAIIEIRNLDTDGASTAAVIFILFGIYIYLTFGRYLSTIALYDHRIEINYIFPWNKAICFRFSKITEIDFKEFGLIDRFTHDWHRGGKWLYLKNEKDEVCQFKYNIGLGENKMLLEALQKKLNSDIVCS